MKSTGLEDCHLIDICQGLCFKLAAYTNVSAPSASGEMAGCFFYLVRIIIRNLVPAPDWVLESVGDPGDLG